MLNKRMEKAINSQINAEIYSSYLYLSMSAYFEAISLDISIGMPTLFANLAASRSWHISSQKIAQLRFHRDGMK